jgi:hypothetical protein
MIRSGGRRRSCKSLISAEAWKKVEGRSICRYLHFLNTTWLFEAKLSDPAARRVVFDVLGREEFTQP